MSRLTPFLDDIVLFLFILLVVGTLALDLLPWALLAGLVWFVSKLWLFRSHLRAPVTGTEAMVGRVARAMQDLAPRGQVDIDGEIWDAEAGEHVRSGELVRIEAVEGLQLKVVPAGALGGPVRNPPRGSWLLALAERLKRK